MTTATIRSLAAKVWDQDSHDERDLAFLAAIGRAEREWDASMSFANQEYGGGTKGWQAVKNLATRQRDADYARALAVFEARDEEEAFSEAAE